MSGVGEWQTLNSSTLRRVGLGGAFVLVALWAILLVDYFSRSLFDRLWILGSMLYWLMPVLLSVAAFAFLWGRPKQVAQAIWRLWPGILLAALLVIACFKFIVPHMRVQFDETCLVSTSQTMHDRRLDFRTMDKFTKGAGPQALNWEIDKRPPLFPFLISAIHDLRGYFVENAFLANQGILFLFLVFIYAWILSSYGPLAGLAAQLLVLGPPMVLWSAASAGMDLLSCLFFAAVICSAIALARHPSMIRIARFLTLGLLFSYCRYENFGFFFLALTSALFISRTHPAWKSDLLSRMLICLLGLTALLLTPLALLFAHTFWHGDNFEVAKGAPLFSLGYAWNHLTAFLMYFPDARVDRPFGAAGLFLFAVLWAAFRSLKERRGTLETIFLGGATTVSFMLTIVFYAGDVEDRSQLRLFLPITMLAALGPVFVWARLPARVPMAVLIVAAGIFLGVQVPRVQGSPFGPDEFRNPVMRGIDGLLPRLGTDKAHILIVSDYAQYLIINGFNSIAPITFLQRQPTIEGLKRAGTTSDIFLLYTNDERGLFVDSAEQFNRILHDFSWELLAATRDQKPLRLYHLKKL